MRRLNPCILIALAVSCSAVSAPCACSPAPAAGATVYGIVSVGPSTTNTPALTATSRDGACASQPLGSSLNHMSVARLMGGRYSLFLTGPGGPRCVTVFAVVDQLFRRDSVTIEFRVPNDSARVDFSF